MWRLRDSWESRAAYVRTMGLLHVGHLALAPAAKCRAEQVVTSISTNPTQFGNPKDLDAYPRALKLNRAMLKAAGVTALFQPTVAEIFFNRDDTRSRQHTSDAHITARCRRTTSGGRHGGARALNIAQPDVVTFGENGH